MTFGDSAKPGCTLSFLLDGLMRIKRPSMEGPTGLFDETITGDWIVRKGASDEQVVEELSAILHNELASPIRLEFRTVERPVYVASGVYKHRPVQGGRDKDTTVFADRTVTADAIETFGKQLVRNSGAGGGWGKFSEFLNWLSNWIGAPIVSDVKQPPNDDLSWFQHARSPSTKEIEAEDHDPALVLANVTAQTGLSFRKETRPVRILFVSRREP